MGRGSARAGCKVNQPSSNLKPTQTAFLSYQFHSHLVIINVRYLLNIKVAYKHVLEAFVIAECRGEEGGALLQGGLVTQARTRTHKYTHTQTEMRTRQCGDPCNERGGRVPLLITPLSLSHLRSVLHRGIHSSLHDYQSFQCVPEFSLSAPKVLLEYLSPMITIPSNQPNPIPSIPILLQGVPKKSS